MNIIDRQRRVRLFEALAILTVIVAGVAVLVPMLIHGRVVGETDLLSGYGLTKQPNPASHVHVYQNSDIVNSLIPWSYTVWQQVHHGHLPLWNTNAGLGMPLAFNWQSAPFSLPTMVGYLVPVRDALTTGVIVNIVVAGTGAYFLGRVMRLTVVASAFVGIVFELSGPFVAWLGYPFPAVTSWAGWIFGFGLLVLRQRHRAGLLVALAISVAFSLYGGAPEGFLVVMLAAAVFFAYVLVSRARWLGGDGPILRPALDLIVATIAGCALAAPFALPAGQLAQQSGVHASQGGGALRLHQLAYLALPAFDGLPIIHRGHLITIGVGLPTAFYTQDAMYVGVIALVLGGIGLIVNRRNKQVQGIAIVALACFGLVFVPLVANIAGKLPVLDSVNLRRALMPMALMVAVLGGFGLDAVVKDRAAKISGRLLAIGFGTAALALVSIWVFGRGNLTPAQASVRSHSFIWPAFGVLSGGLAAAFLLAIGRRSIDGSHRTTVVKWAGPLAGTWLLLAEAAFLVSAGTTMMQSSTSLAPQTQVTRALVRAVGSQTVAMASGYCQLGLEPNTNDVYGVNELEVYDPIIPKAFFTDWTHDTHLLPGGFVFHTFCAQVDSATIAREFGVSFILQSYGSPAPAGTKFVKKLGDENLYRVPGGAAATVVEVRSSKLPPFNVTGTPVPVAHPSPSEWAVKTSSGHEDVLRLHLSNVPGWQATIDGKPLALRPYGGLMLQALVPAGAHQIDLYYWPTAFTIGIALACLSALFLAILLVFSSPRLRALGHRARLGVGHPQE